MVLKSIRRRYINACSPRQFYTLSLAFASSLHFFAISSVAMSRAGIVRTKPYLCKKRQTICSQHPNF